MEDMDIRGGEIFLGPACQSAFIVEEIMEAYHQ
jgi:hypothetical protein